jgi:hypothetical protein
MARGGDGPWVRRNEGIVSSGDYTSNTIANTFQIAAGALVAAADVEPPPNLVRLPGSGFFVGREAELAALARVLIDGAGVVSQALTGLGGIGKSTLARQYALTHRHEYNPIWWISAEDGEQIDLGIGALARRIQPVLAALPDAVAVEWGMAWLASHRGWLLVLDNVNGPSDVAGLLAAAPGGAFVITSRRTTGWGGPATPVQLGVFEPAESVRLLELVAGPELAVGAAELVAALGHLPLAVQQAAAYLEQNQVTAAVYLERLGDVLAWTPEDGDAQRTVARLWQTSIDRIAVSHGPLSGEILRALAWFGPDDVPIEAILRLDLGVDEIAIEEALGRLAAYALITRTADGVSVHPLVQTVNRRGQDEVVRKSKELAAKVLLAGLPGTRDPEGWPVWRRRQPHIEAIVDHTRSDQGDTTLAELVGGLGRYLQAAGSPEAAVPLHQREWEIRRQLHGENSADTLAARHELANACLESGDVTRALALHEEVLAARRRQPDTVQIDILRSQLNLARACTAAKDIRRTIDLLESTFSAANRILGEDHRFSVAVMENLANAYGAAQNPEMAAHLLRYVLDYRLRVDGEDDVGTVRTRFNLAVADFYAGELDSATRGLVDAAAASKRLLGPDHPLTVKIRDFQVVAG